MPDRNYDVIVIGSGIGGLACASLLAQMASKRVLVLERHFKLGGFTHTFTRKGFRWDVGVHYVGGVGEGSMGRRLFDFITGSGVAWQKTPHIFEKFSYPDFTFDVADDRKSYMQALITSFPAEEEAIRRYFRDIDRVNSWFNREMAANVMPAPIASAVALANRLGRGRALQTTGAYLERTFKDNRLRALLASQWGDYGLPPAQSAFAIHALIVGHYLKGGYYPVDGGKVIAESIVPIIEAEGGACLVNHRVSEILIEGGRATGVKVQTRAGDLVFRAPVVISDAGATTTFLKLLPEHVTLPFKGTLESMSRGYGTVTLYLGLKESPAILGFKGENHWLYNGYDHDALFRQRNELLEGRVSGCYLSFPSLKDQRAKNHAAEIVAPLDMDGLEGWREAPWKRRGDAYETLKSRICEALLAFVEARYPGFRDLVCYQELSTPLTTESLTGHPQGAVYGLPATPERYRQRWLKPRTPVKGLLLTGSDAASHGIMGALMGGVMSASLLVGGAGFPRIIAASQAHGTKLGRDAASTTKSQPSSQVSAK